MSTHPPIPDPTDTTPLRRHNERRFRLTPLRVALIVLSVLLVVLTALLYLKFRNMPIVYSTEVANQ
jgi:hypothetical protein